MEDTSDFTDTASSSVETDSTIDSLPSSSSKKQKRPAVDTKNIKSKKLVLHMKYQIAKRNYSTYMLIQE